MRNRPRKLRCLALGILLILLPHGSSLLADAVRISAPTLLTPPTNTEILFRIPARGSLALTWRAEPSVTAYRIVVAKSADLGQLVIQRRTTESYVVVRGLQEGKYFWRVEALPVDGTPAVASAIATFTISVGAPL